jgi:CheY-like chemotaxis protein
MAEKRAACGNPRTRGETKDTSLRNATQASKVVLVVEDNPDDIGLVQAGARNAECPFNFKFVEDGDQALCYLEGAGRYADRCAYPLPDLVVLDLNMPRRDGFEVLKWIRTRLRFEHLQVIVWTGWDRADTSERARRAGANLFLRKPDEASGWITFIGMISLALNGLAPQNASTGVPV